MNIRIILHTSDLPLDITPQQHHHVQSSLFKSSSPIKMELSESAQYTDAANRLMTALHLSNDDRRSLAGVVAPEFEETDSLAMTVDKIGSFLKNLIQSRKNYQTRASPSELQTKVKAWVVGLIPYLRFVLLVGQQAISLVILSFFSH